MTHLHTHSSQRRSRQIASTLARHGLGFLVDVLGLEQFIPFHRGLFKHPRRAQPYTRPEHVRMALEELGATWIKLGQILSTRSDLLPPEYQAELARLQDAAPTIPFEQVRETVSTQLGRPLEETFATFDPTPLAAASIGQAHAATLPDGTEVVVKVRRPGVVEQVEEDLEIFQQFAATASRRWETAIWSGWPRSLPSHCGPNLTISVKATTPSASLTTLLAIPQCTSLAFSGT
jgi:ubiquinone biosynthesis protein